MKGDGKIKRKIWYWLIPMLNLFDYICFRLPLVLFCLFVFESIIYYTDFYYNNYPILNRVDSFFVILMLFHSLVLMRLRDYNFVNLSLYICILLVVGLNFEVAYYPMSVEQYIFLYRLILCTTFGVIIFNEYINRNLDE